jgi:hypothetical protein
MGHAIHQQKGGNGKVSKKQYYWVLGITETNIIRGPSYKVRNNIENNEIPEIWVEIRESRKWKTLIGVKYTWGGVTEHTWTKWANTDWEELLGNKKEKTSWGWAVPSLVQAGAS